MKPAAPPAQAGLVIRLHDSPGERRVALLAGQDLLEFHIDRAAAPDGIGDLHLGRVTALVPAMAGAFLALNDTDAFLPDSDGAKGLSEGTILPVRITRAAQGGKGPRVTARVGATAGVVPPDAGTRLRLLERGPSALEEMQAAYPDVPVEVAPFEDALEVAIDALALPHAALHGGLVASFSVTPALTAIDLDGAGTTGGRQAKAAAQMQANQAALPALVRQIVLRNLSGAILIDFAGLATRKRRALSDDLAAALGADRLRPRLAGFSHLGFAEIERARRRPPLHEKLTSALGLGLAALRRVAVETRATPSRRLALRADPAIAQALAADTAALAALARLTTYPLVLRGDPALARTWSIEDV